MEGRVSHHKCHMRDAKRKSECNGRPFQREQFLQRLSEKGLVGQSFERLVQHGCDAELLFKALAVVAILPWGRSEKPITARARKQIEVVVADLAAASETLERYRHAMMFCRKGGEWPIPPHELPRKLRDISNCLQQWIAEPSRAKSYTAAQYVPQLVSDMIRKTGKPHYRELATLLSAAYSEVISEPQLKALISRYKASIRRGNVRRPK